MTRRPTLLRTLALAVTASLALSACGSDDGSQGEGEGKGAVAGTGNEASPPRIVLPSDLTYTFDWPRTGNRDKDAVLADSEQSIKAVDLAIVNQDPLDEAYLYYYDGEAAVGTQEFIDAYVKAKARVTGAYRYYNATVGVSGKNTASLVYCENQSKAYDLYLETKKVNRTPTTKNSYVLYTTELRKNGKGVWAVEKIESQRGSAECQP